MSHNNVRIGKASGPVVAGDGNHVEIHHAAPEPAPAESGPTQNNTAKDHGTLFTVMKGDLHVHQDGSGTSDQGKEENEGGGGN
ncbi:hypothetical protein ACQB60_06650 [Actinomycetota bacterium Odt1-20B]